jgi:nitroreductase
MNTSFDCLSRLIRQRRTIKAPMMNGQKIPDMQIWQLLELADWAPNHGHTEPWRFRVYTDEALEEFGKIHAELYWTHVPEQKRQQAKYDKLILSAQRASHLIVVVMKRGGKEKIPDQEEFAAVAAATENILLGAASLDIAAIWSTGGMTYHPALKQHLALDADERVTGLLYLGYSDQPAKGGERRIPLTDKVIWHA